MLDIQSVGDDDFRVRGVEAGRGVEPPATHLLDFFCAASSLRSRSSSVPEAVSGEGEERLRHSCGGDGSGDGSGLKRSHELSITLRRSRRAPKPSRHTHARETVIKTRGVFMKLTGSGHRVRSRDVCTCTCACTCTCRRSLENLRRLLETTALPPVAQQARRSIAWPLLS